MRSLQARSVRRDRTFTAPPGRPWPDQPLCMPHPLGPQGTAGVPNGDSWSLLRSAPGGLCNCASGLRSAWPPRAARQIQERRVTGLPGDERSEDVGRVPVQAGAGPVVAHGGARVGVGCGFLHIAQRDSGVEGGGDERVPQGVRADVLGDPGAAGYPADDPGGAVPAGPPPVASAEERSFGALADRQVDRAGGARCERDGDDLAALPGEITVPVPGLV